MDYPNLIYTRSNVIIPHGTMDLIIQSLQLESLVVPVTSSLLVGARDSQVGHCILKVLIRCSSSWLLIISATIS